MALEITLLRISPTPIGLTPGCLSRAMSRLARRGSIFSGFTHDSARWRASLAVVRQRCTDASLREEHIFFHVPASTPEGPAAPRERREMLFTRSAAMASYLTGWTVGGVPSIRVSGFGSGRTGSKIVSKFRLTHNRKLRSANRNTIYHTIACPALLLWCLAVENRGPCVPNKCSLSNCASPGRFLLPSSRSLVIPWPTPLAHSFTDDGHVPAENLLPK